MTLRLFAGIFKYNIINKGEGGVLRLVFYLHIIVAITTTVNMITRESEGI